MKGWAEQVGGGPFAGKWRHCDHEREGLVSHSICTSNCPAKDSGGVSRHGS